jgi:integrase
VLAYGGLRPSELLALRWDAIRERTLLVERAADNGKIKPTKGTGRARTVRLLGPLAADLAVWRMACGRPRGDARCARVPRPQRSGVARRHLAVVAPGQLDAAQAGDWDAAHPALRPAP